MFRTKKDVDRHVADILSKIKNENERNLRGYTFAKLYYVVKDFESAKRYLSGFLSLKEKNPTAHKLMAQIYENTGHLEKAVQSYKKSLELEENQKDVVLKICELYCQLTVDPDRARYWADRAEKLFPHNDIVFRLRECIMSADGAQNSQELEDLITSELATRPRDVKLRIKLLRLYLDTERIREAYEHAVEVELKKPHVNSLDWYYCLNDVFESYLEDNTQECNKDFYINFLSATDRLVYLILEEKRGKDKFRKNNQTSSIADSATALHSFDQHLFKAMQLNETQEDAWEAFLNHMNGQLYFHFGTLILIRAKKDQANMKEALRMGSTLLLLSYTYKPPDLQSSWFSQASEAMKREYQHWYEQACFRLSQCGHVVVGLCKEDRVKWLQKLKQQICSPLGKEKIFQRVFSSREYRESVATSQFMQSSTFQEFLAEFPDIKALHEYDDVASLLYPDSLHHIVWLALQYYNVKDKVQPDYGFKVFDGLQFSVNNLNTAAPETLCQLDIDSFLYATVRTCALALEERQTIMYSSIDISTHLPVNISDWLCTQEQAEWWSAAYSLFRNLGKENLGELRRILQHGIEIVRVMGCHGMDVNLVIHLAETFADRTSELKNQVDNDLDRANEINSLGNRAAHFWKAAVGMLEKLSNNQTYRIPKSRMFESYNQDPSTEEVKKLLESGHFYLACQSMNAGHHEEAITAFESLKSAYASFYQAVIYKKLAAEEYNKPRETITSEMRSKHIILLTRARDALYVTLDRIRGDRKHPLNQVLSDEIEDIETKLARIDPDTAQRHEFDGLSDEMLSSQESVEQEDLESPNQHRNQENQNHHKHHDSRRARGSHTLLQNMPALSLPFVTPPHCDPSPEHVSRHREEHNRPSPERLDAQMRSLAYSHDAVIKTIMEQNKALIETNRSIVEELKQNKIVVEQLKGQLEDIHKQILVSRSRRRKFSKLPLMGPGRLPQQVNGAPQVDVEDNPEEEEEYYEGYYYEDDIGYELDEPENTFHDYTYNAAYKYPDAQLQNDYPYGQVTGLHGTSTVTYAPPAGRTVGVPPHHPQSSYAAYYSQSHHTVQTLGPPRGPTILHGHSSHPTSALTSPQLGPGYFSTPTTAISARLPFSEGQKLPEFNFNTAPAVPSPSLPLSVDKNSYSQVGTVGQAQIVMPAAPLEPPVAFPQSMPAAIPENVNMNNGMKFSTPRSNINYTYPPTATSTMLMLNSGMFQSLGGGTIHPSVVAATAAPHIFQIPLPPHAVIVTSTSGGFTKALYEGVSNSSQVTGSVTVSSSQAYISPPKQSFSSSTHSTLDANRLRKESEGKERTVSEGDSYQEEEYSGPEFKPVIPLPAEVEIKTGEEEENKFFEERAKLFRFIEKEWKERGTGVVKILHNETTGKVRLLMRRDQILKVCANHYIIPDMKLSPMKNSETAWVWAAQDFADEEVRTEQFCIRFKTAEIAQKFKKEFDRARELLSKANSNSKICTATEQKLGPSAEGFGDKFKPKPGSWTCTTCLINNSSDKTSCAACETPKPGVKASEATSSVASKFAFSGSSSGFNFYTSSSQQSNTSTVSAFIMPSSNTGTTTTSTPFTCGMLTTTASSLATPVFSLPTSTTTIAGGTPKTFTFGINPASVSKNEAGLSTSATTALAVSSPQTIIFGMSAVTPTTSGSKSEHPEPFIFGQTPVNSQSNNKESPAFVFGSSGSSPQQSKPSGFIFGASTLPKDSDKLTGETNPGPASVLLSALATKHQEAPVSSSSQETKTINYGGFTFTGTPTIKVTNDSTSKKEIKTSPLKTKELVSKDEAVKSEQAKPSPFAGFSFNISKQDSSKSATSQPFTETSKAIENNTPLFIQNVSPELSFTSLAKSASETPVLKRDPNFAGFKGVGHRLFDPVNASGDKQESPDTSHEYESTAEFKPVIPMPELVELKTGEEEEDKLFAERAKLFRYDFSVKQWKERGIGEMKILQHRETKRCRILMRREQVFKICANHYILPNMQLKTLLSSDKAWSWFANDFSDGVIKPEHLAVKFKTIDIAKSFEKVFSSCVELASKRESESGAGLPKDAEEKANDRPLSDMFRNEAGSWECTSCLLINKPAILKCLACQADRPIKAAADQPVSSSNQLSSTLGTSGFKSSKSNESEEEKLENIKDTRPLSELFKPEVGSWECSACCVRNKSGVTSCVACSTIRPGHTQKVDDKQINTSIFGSTSAPQFQFGKSSSEGNVGFNMKSLPTSLSNFNFSSLVTTTSATSTTTTSSIKSGFLASDISTVTVGTMPLSSSTESSGSFQFGFQFEQKAFPSPSSGNNSTDESTSAVEFRFGSPQKFTFSFSGVRPKSPAKTPKSPHGTADDSGELSEEVEGESDDHIYFQPVVPLPDKIEVKTGEEDEQVLYCQRAKLFRLFESEWKERGIGEFKILQHLETKKIRLLMRREQVLKICLNHYLTTDLKFVEKDERSWLWVATDFADNEPHQESLAIRFKTSEIAKQFIEAINSAKDFLKNNTASTPPIQRTNSKTDNSVTKHDKTISATNSQSQEITKPTSTLNNFSFKLDSSKFPDTSPTSAFSFGNKFGSTVGYPKATSLFGGTSPKDKGSPPEVSSTSSLSDASDIEVVYMKEATPEQIAKAKALMLPSNFYLYENVPPCPGCRGCEDRLDINFSKLKKVDVEVVHEEKANPEQIEKSRMFQLPSNFYLYENKSPCPGCRGCKDDTPHPQEEEKEDKSVDEIQPQVEPDSTTSEAPPYFGNISASGVDFASIAKQSSSSFLSTSPTRNFIFAGFGAKVFQSSNQDKSEEVDESPVPSHDPHFEPIVPLPALITVTTGEEEEDKIYGQRARLYRFDSDAKQWKERGIGEMKILKHKVTGKYRLLMRREQVLKIACNHNISSDIELKPLSSSETAWCWYAMDFADETPQFQQLAVKFKTINLAQEFKQKFEECQQEVKNSSLLETSESDSMTVHELDEKENGKTSDSTKEAAPQSPSPVTKDVTETKSALESSTSTSNEETDSGFAYLSSSIAPKSSENTEEDDNDDNDDESVMFEKRVSLSYFDTQINNYQMAGMGNLRILYDDDVYGARIQVTTDDGQLICNHLIAIQTTLEVNGKNCHWAALDFSKVPPVRRRFRAAFSSPAAAEQFNQMFKEGKECAKAAEILERPYDSALTMEDLINSTVEALYSKAPDREGGKSNRLTLPIKLTATGEEIKACSPELAAAVKDIIEGYQEEIGPDSNLSTLSTLSSLSLSSSSFSSSDTADTCDRIATALHLGPRTINSARSSTSTSFSSIDTTEIDKPCTFCSPTKPDNPSP